MQTMTLTERPKSEVKQQLCIRVKPSTIAAIDAYARKHNEKSTSDMLNRLLEATFVKPTAPTRPPIISAAPREASPLDRAVRKKRAAK